MPFFAVYVCLQYVCVQAKWDINTVTLGGKVIKL